MNINDAASRILDIKKQEAALKEERIMIEDSIASIISKKEEGTDCIYVDNHRITVTSKLKRTLDYPAYQAVEDNIPENFRCVRLKPEIDLKKLRLMDEVKPGFSANFITTEPSRAVVKVEVL